MERETIFTKMVMCTKDNGKTVRKMEKELFTMKKAEDLMECLSMTKKMGKPFMLVQKM